MDINRYLFIFIGWLIRTSYQIECLQCTSPIRRSSHNWDHSCLDGTLLPLPCEGSIDISASTFKQCVSSLYRLGQRGSAGVLIYRGCTKMHSVPHDCDPPVSTIDVETTLNFYCSLACSIDGCNRHSVLFSMQFVLLMEIKK
ncbi:unnamed protein product [Rotaria sordida]|uniref:Protein sleepless n=1 Tax=Rotaria sordida TaxID=392033 RepID=A0A815AES1_9BILA|nr:unnamed protein product [Rotaria sordida]